MEKQKLSMRGFTRLRAQQSVRSNDLNVPHTVYLKSQNSFALISFMARLKTIDVFKTVKKFLNLILFFSSMS